MSSTRHATPDSPLRQERYSSSPAFISGLKAHLIARRCSKIERAEDREIIWLLQSLSHSKTGMAGVCDDIISQFDYRLGTSSMIGLSTGVCTAKQVIAIREEMPKTKHESFLLQDELSEREILICEVYENPLYPEAEIRHPNYAKEAHRSAAARPVSYPVSSFREVCRDAARENLCDYLMVFCIDPEAKIDCPPWYFAALFECLREFQKQWAEKQRENFVETAVVKEVYSAIDFSTGTRQMILATGKIGSGVSSAAKSWCNQFPGCARYVLTPSSNNQRDFFMAIAGALGVPDGFSKKVSELKERCEQALQGRDITLIFDSANDLLPNTNLRESMPDRIQWILSALIPNGVPVVLLGLPNFLEKLRLFHGKGGWTAPEFTSQCDCRELPELGVKDIAEIARSILPGIDKARLKDLCAYAVSSPEPLSVVRKAKRTADFEAKKSGRSEANGEDVSNALNLRVIPSDRAITKEVPKIKSRASGSRSALVAPAAREPMASTPRSIGENHTEFQVNRNSSEAVLQ